MRFWTFQTDQEFNNYNYNGGTGARGHGGTGARGHGGTGARECRWARGTEANGYDDKRNTKAKDHSDMETTEVGHRDSKARNRYLIVKAFTFNFLYIAKSAFK